MIGDKMYEKELEELDIVRDLVEQVRFVFEMICWPDSIQEPHHVRMELEAVESKIHDRISHVEFLSRRVCSDWYK